MKVAVCYIVVTHGTKTEHFTSRFVATYHAYPPGVEHDTVIIANGGGVSTPCAVLLSILNPIVLPRRNDGGWDISGYIEAARGHCAKYDMMFCLGESNYFHRNGWLKRIVEAWELHGPGMYGPYATNVIRGHLQTTAFACAPKMLAAYPRPVLNKKDRYAFEHGQHALWRIVRASGKPTMLVTWDGEWGPEEWRTPQNILWRGDQSNCLMWSNHSDRWRDTDNRRKSNWSVSADRIFR